MLYKWQVRDRCLERMQSDIAIVPHASQGKRLPPWSWVSALNIFESLYQTDGSI